MSATIDTSYVAPPNTIREEFHLPMGTKIVKSATRSNGTHSIVIEPKGTRDLTLTTQDHYDGATFMLASGRGTGELIAIAAILHDEDLEQLHQALGDHLARRHLVKAGLYLE